jgi:hypothetical protein
MIDSLDSSPFPCLDEIPGVRLAEFKRYATADRPRFTHVMPNPRGAPTLFLVQTFDDVLTVGAVSTRYIVERGNSIAFGEKGHAAIVDHTGRLMAHPLPSWVATM